MKLQGFWAAIDHNIEVEAVGIHGRKDDCNGDREKK